MKELKKRGGVLLFFSISRNTKRKPRGRGKSCTYRCVPRRANPLFSISIYTLDSTMIIMCIYVSEDNYSTWSFIQCGTISSWQWCHCDVTVIASACQYISEMHMYKHSGFDGGPAKCALMSRLTWNHAYCI